MRKQALAAAVQERDRANGYLEAAQTILLALDLEGRVTLINRKGCEVLGLEEGDLLGKDWFDCALPSEERDAGSARFRQFLASSTEKPWPIQTVRSPAFCARAMTSRMLGERKRTPGIRASA
jgi:PAS domain S-box-containing protein